MKEFLEYIVKNIVNHPDEVCVTEISGTHAVILELRVHPDDVGSVIGRNGKTINAIRVLLVSMANRLKIRVSVEIVEEPRPVSPPTN